VEIAAAETPAGTPGATSSGSDRPETAETSGGRLHAVASADGRSWSADAFVFAAGPWLATLFPELVGDVLRVTKQDVILLGAPPGDPRYRIDRLPVWSEFDAPFYGVPAIDGGGFKVAPDSYGPAFDPTDGQRLVSPESIARVRDQVRRRFPGLAHAPVVETRVCQYESTPDTHFIIDRHPGWSNVWIVGGGSGHAFKHGPAIGAYVVALLEGRTADELEGVDGARFRIGPRLPGPGMRAGHEQEAVTPATR
jgi:glycine/D-amino acid oxidase-like deaminating enzyme